MDGYCLLTPVTSPSPFINNTIDSGGLCVVADLFANSMCRQEFAISPEKSGCEKLLTDRNKTSPSSLSMAVAGSAQWPGSR